MPSERKDESLAPLTSVVAHVGDQKRLGRRLDTFEQIALNLGDVHVHPSTLCPTQHPHHVEQPTKDTNKTQAYQYPRPAFVTNIQQSKLRCQQ